MPLIYGDFLDGLKAPNAIVIAPTNGYITRNGLIMGAGAAWPSASVSPNYPD